MAENEETTEITGLPGLRRVRELAGVNGARLAQMVGLTASMISQIESGKRDPSHGALLRLSRALGCTIDQLSARPGDYPKSLSDFLSTIAPDDITDDEIEILRMLRMPGRRITARAYNNLLDAVRNSERIQ